MTVARKRVLAEEEKNVGIRGTQNSPRAVVGTRRDDGIFITTRFAPGIILGTFSRELSVEEARAGEFARATAGNEFTCRHHVLTVFFLCHAVDPLMWKTCYENLRTQVYYFRLLISIETAVEEIIA